MAVQIARSANGPARYRLTTQLLVDEPPEQVFNFFSDAFRLEKITPDWLHFSVQTPRPIEMQSGTLIDYQLRVRGFPLRWRSRISDWKPPFLFVDEQLRGPYRYWRHLHTFDEVDGGTLVRDVVHYAVPLGFIVHPLFVRAELCRIFDFRREMMSELFTPRDTRMDKLAS